MAIGRALLAQPLLLLMDEPLASLDAARKAEILPFLLRLNAALALPTLYVTHAMDEVVQLASSLVLLEHGRVVASGPLTELSARADLPLAARPDAAAVIAATVAAHDLARGLTQLDCGGAMLLVPLRGEPVGTALRARIAAQEVILAGPGAAAFADQISLHNVLPGTVRAIVPDGGAALCLGGGGAGAGRAALSSDAGCDQPAAACAGPAGARACEVGRD